MKIAKNSYAPGEIIASYRSIFGHRFLYPFVLLALVLMIWNDRRPYAIGNAVYLHFNFCAFMLAVEAFRKSRVTFYSNGIKQSSWFRSKFYTWDTFGKVIWTTNYLGGSKYERRYASHMKTKIEGLFFINTSGVPVLSVRNPSFYKCEKKIAHLPNDLPVEKTDERITYWSPIWDDITPRDEYPSLRKDAMKYIISILAGLSIIPNAISFWYINEYFLALPRT